MDLALNDLQRLICHKTQQTKSIISDCDNTLEEAIIPTTLHQALVKSLVKLGSLTSLRDGKL